MVGRQLINGFARTAAATGSEGSTRSHGALGRFCLQRETLVAGGHSDGPLLECTCSIEGNSCKALAMLNGMEACRAAHLTSLREVALDLSRKLRWELGWSTSMVWKARSVNLGADLLANWTRDDDDVDIFWLAGPPSAQQGKLVCSFDGASRNNPGLASAAAEAWIQIGDAEWNLMGQWALRLGHTTNNVAELTAAILTVELALCWAARLTGQGAGAGWAPARDAAAGAYRPRAGFGVGFRSRL